MQLLRLAAILSLLLPSPPYKERNRMELEGGGIWERRVVGPVA
jgi:hypothetical protein